MKGGGASFKVLKHNLVSGRGEKILNFLPRKLGLLVEGDNLIEKAII